MSMQSRLRGYRDGQRDAANGLPASAAGRDANYLAGYRAGYAERERAEDAADRRAAVDGFARTLQSALGLPSDKARELAQAALRKHW